MKWTTAAPASTTPLSSTLLSTSSPPSSSSSASDLQLSSSSLSSSPSSPSVSIMRHIFLSVAIVLLYTGTLSQACFIRNCPKGGKRSMDSSMTVAQRPCLSCGPGNTGQCVGPNICCSPQFGCHFGTPETDVCLKENESMTPCYVMGDVCGTRDNGRCVAHGICCDSESCAMNGRCNHIVNNSSQDRGKILQLLERLLQTKNYD